MNDQERAVERSDDMRIALADSHLRQARRAEPLGHGDCEGCQMAHDIIQQAAAIRALRSEGDRLDGQLNAVSVQVAMLREALKKAIVFHHATHKQIASCVGCPESQRVLAATAPAEDPNER